MWKMESCWREDYRGLKVVVLQNMEARECLGWQSLEAREFLEAAEELLGGRVWESGEILER